MQPSDFRALIGRVGSGSEWREQEFLYMASTRENKKFSREVSFVPESHFESFSWIKFPYVGVPGNRLKTLTNLARKIVQIAQVARRGRTPVEDFELESKSRSVGGRGDGYIGCKI